MDAPSPSSPDATLLMNAAADGDKTAADRLLPLVYEQLRKSAHIQMAAERRDHTLSATALVHEVYLRLVGPREVAWHGRAHFYAAAAKAMRRILVEHARAGDRKKRGGDRHRMPLDVIDLATQNDAHEILALDDAVCRLEKEEPELAGVVHLRFFAGLTVDETAAALGLSPRTVDQYWTYARAWLYRAIEGHGDAS